MREVDGSVRAADAAEAGEVSVTPNPLDELLSMELAITRLGDALRALGEARSDTREAEDQLKSAQQRGWDAGLELQAATREWRRICAAIDKLLPAP